MLLLQLFLNQDAFGLEMFGRKIDIAVPFLILPIYKAIYGDCNSTHN